MLLDNKDIKERNKQIVKAYEKGYSQHMIAKVLKINQATVQRIIKGLKDDSVSITYTFAFYTLIQKPKHPKWNLISISYLYIVKC